MLKEVPGTIHPDTQQKFCDIPYVPSLYILSPRSQGPWVRFAIALYAMQEPVGYALEQALSVKRGRREHMIAKSRACRRESKCHLRVYIVIKSSTQGKYSIIVIIHKAR